MPNGDDNMIVYGVMIVALFLLLCGAGAEYFYVYKPFKENMDVKVVSQTGDLTNAYGNTNKWNERSDKRQDHEGGLIWAYNERLGGGSRTYEALYPEFRNTTENLPWESAHDLKETCNGKFGLGLDKLESAAIKYHPNLAYM